MNTSLTPITINLSDNSGLDANTATVWVAGWINGGIDGFAVLNSTGDFDQVSNSVEVQANQAWQSTGISIVKDNPQNYKATYKSGAWTADPSTNNGQLYNANGCPNLLVPAAQTSYPIVGISMGVLVGKVGKNGTPFEIGDNTLVVPGSEEGELYLCINDDLTGQYGAGLSDNSGSLTVDVQGTAQVPYYKVSDIATVSLANQTNGNDRLLFVVSKDQPSPLTVSSQQPIEYTAYPYANSPGVASPGPYDVFEFGYNAQADLSAVNGFGLNLSFTYSGTSYGVDTSINREEIGTAFTTFITAETTANTAASAYQELLYNGSIGGSSPTPPSVDGQFFAIADPNDMLQAKMILGTADSDPLATYWDTLLEQFFKVGNYLSISLSASGESSRTYSGISSSQTNSKTGVSSSAFTLSNGTDSHTIYQPPSGLKSALYVFQQAFNDLTPAGSGGDAGLLQDSIWEALCRGVAVNGVSTTAISSGESTTAWNKSDDWYKAGSVCHLYAKFLHYSTKGGTDSRIKGNGSPIFYNNAVYGFSMDENPMGKYSGPNVPAKTIDNVPGGAVIDLTIGPWK